MSICSVVVHAKPARGPSIQTALERIPGVEVHAGAAVGKLVVTVEGPNDDTLADTMAQFNHVEGVINTVMVYHYCGEEYETEEVSP